MTTIDRITTQYGEALMISQVMRILNCGRVKVNLLCQDGILTKTIDGRRITAASVARYIDGDPTAIDHRRRMEKRYSFIPV